MNIYESVSSACVFIQCGGGRGSGFFLDSPNLVATNTHVVIDSIKNNKDIFIQNKFGESGIAELLYYCESSLIDSAILLMPNNSLPSSAPLKSSKDSDIKLGTDLLICGYPHGIPDQLIHQGSVSGYTDGGRFYLDASINQGNSGGPIVDRKTGEAIGIVSQRRFMNADSIANLRASAIDILKFCESYAGPTVITANINQTELLASLARNFVTLCDAQTNNSSPGIGIGNHIKYADMMIDAIIGQADLPRRAIFPKSRLSECPCGSELAYKVCCGKPTLLLK